ncbi:MAG: hypothetical protein AB7P40_12935 [Chloroflexota bacterium]
MSILTKCPGPEWYEPADELDLDEDDQPPTPEEVLTVAAGIGWWTASLDLEDQD